MLLALDSSAGTGAALVADDGTVLAERIETDTLRHAEVVGELIAGVLADAGVTAAEVTAVAVGVGPGPFTGLRVGMAAARAFALAAGVPVEGVVSHDALALAVAEGGGPALVVTDARRRERYWSRYAGLDASGLPIRTEGPALAKPDDVPRDAPRHEDGVVPPGALGVLAVRRREAGLPAAPLDPLYLRSPDGHPLRAEAGRAMTEVLRRAEAADLDELVALENAIFPEDAWSRQSFERELANPHAHYLVLVPEGRQRPVLGYAGLLASPPDGDIQTVALAEGLRGRGLGRTLVRALLDEAERRGVTSLFLEVRADNAAAQSLYRSLGFEDLGVRPRYYRGGIDALTMRRVTPARRAEERT